MTARDFEVVFHPLELHVARDPCCVRFTFGQLEYSF